MKFLLSILFFLAISCSQLPARRTDKLSIVQGVTNAKEVEFSIVAPKGRELRFELRNDKGDVIAPDETTVLGRDFSAYVIHKVIFVREAGQDYNLYAFEGEQLVDQRLIGRGQANANELKMIAASCMDDSYKKEFAIWDVVAKKNPEYLLLIGDNVYADRSRAGETLLISSEDLWNRYLDVRLTLPLYYQEKLIPIHAVWDDHDYGRNNGASDFELKKESQEIFNAMWAQDLAEENYSKGFGVGGLLSLGDFNLYFLDGRSFRSSEPQGKHLGFDQEAWLLSKLKEEETPSIVIKGDQFFGAYGTPDSFEGAHPSDFNTFVDKMGKIKTPFMFLSGDRHFSEIMQFPRSLFGRPSFEITSSPAHGHLNTDADTNPWRVVAHKGSNNVVYIHHRAQDNHWFMDVESLGVTGGPYFKRELAVFIKDLQNNLNEIRKKRRSGKRRYRRIRSGRRR